MARQLKLPVNFLTSLWTQRKFTIPFYITPSLRPQRKLLGCRCYNLQASKYIVKMPSHSGPFSSLPEFLEGQTQFSQCQLSLYCQTPMYVMIYIFFLCKFSPPYSPKWERGAISSHLGNTFQSSCTCCNIPLTEYSFCSRQITEECLRKEP